MRWQRVNKCPTEEVIIQKTKILSSLQEKQGLPDLLEIRKLQGKVDDLLEEDKLKRRQRAKEHWLTMVDKNTKYFHSCVKLRRKNNTIHIIFDIEGQHHTTPKAVENAFINYFREICKSSNPSYLSHGLEVLPCRISNVMNEQHLRNFSKDDIWEALRQMAPLKSSSPLDGFLTCFYQDQWETMGPEVCDAILNFLNGGSFENDSNYIHIVLIPKK